MTLSATDLKERRVLLGYSQKRLADELGVLVNTLARWEQGAINIAHPGMLGLALDALETRKAAASKPRRRKATPALS